MKSNATMYRLAKRAAMQAGPRDLNGKAVGFFLTDEEMKTLFTRAGFNTWSSTTWMQRVKSWEQFGDVVPMGLAGIYVKICQTDDKLRLEKAAKNLGVEILLGMN